MGTVRNRKSGSSPKMDSPDQTRTPREKIIMAPSLPSLGLAVRLILKYTTPHTVQTCQAPHHLFSPLTSSQLCHIDMASSKATSPSSLRHYSPSPFPSSSPSFRPAFGKLKSAYEEQSRKKPTPPRRPSHLERCQNWVKKLFRRVSLVTLSLRMVAFLPPGVVLPRPFFSPACIFLYFGFHKSLSYFALLPYVRNCTCVFLLGSTFGNV